MVNIYCGLSLIKMRTKKNKVKKKALYFIKFSYRNQGIIGQLSRFLCDNFKSTSISSSTFTTFHRNLQDHCDRITCSIRFNNNGLIANRCEPDVIDKSNWITICVLLFVFYYIRIEQVNIRIQMSINQ